MLSKWAATLLVYHSKTADRLLGLWRPVWCVSIDEIDQIHFRILECKCRRSDGSWQQDLNSNIRINKGALRVLAAAILSLLETSDRTVHRWSHVDVKSMSRDWLWLEPGALGNGSARGNLSHLLSNRLTTHEWVLIVRMKLIVNYMSGRDETRWSMGWFVLPRDVGVRQLAMSNHWSSRDCWWLGIQRYKREWCVSCEGEMKWTVGVWTKWSYLPGELKERMKLCDDWHAKMLLLGTELAGQDLCLSRTSPQFTSWVLTSVGDLETYISVSWTLITTFWSKSADRAWCCSTIWVSDTFAIRGGRQAGYFSVAEGLVFGVLITAWTAITVRIFAPFIGTICEKSITSNIVDFVGRGRISSEIKSA